jgi:hypothetical protein
VSRPGVFGWTMGPVEMPPDVADVARWTATGCCGASTAMQPRTGPAFADGLARGSTHLEGILVARPRMLTPRHRRFAKQTVATAAPALAPYLLITVEVLDA